MTPTDSQAARLHEELVRVLALLESATPGPWRTAYEGGGDVTIYGPETELTAMVAKADEGERVFDLDGPSELLDPDVLGSCWDAHSRSFIENEWNRKNSANAEAICAMHQLLRKHGVHIAETFKETPNG